MKKYFILFVCFAVFVFSSNVEAQTKVKKKTSTSSVKKTSVGSTKKTSTVSAKENSSGSQKSNPSVSEIVLPAGFKSTVTARNLGKARHIAINNNGDIYIKLERLKSGNGIIRLRDKNGDGKIDADDRTFIGDPNPDFTYGLNIAFNYKNFDFSTFFFGSKGNDIFNQTKYFTDFPDFFKGGIRREVALNSWTPTNTGATIPMLRTTGNFGTDLSGNGTSYFVSKGSYLRNKQIQLGYTVPGKVLSRFGIERLRIYVQAANMFTITKYNGFDPELQSSDINGNVGFGIDQGNFPHTPAYLVGVNLNF